MQKQIAEHRPDDMNLSASRTLDGVSLNAASIPAINPLAIRRSDNGAEVVDPVAIAPPALKTSRRGFLMNTMVSAASLATAAAVTAPSIVSAAPADNVSFPGLVNRFLRIRERWYAQQELDKADPDQDMDARGSSIAWPGLCAEGRSVVEAMLSQKPQSIADLAWQTEAILMVDAELLDGCPEYPMIPRLLQNIRALGGPLSIAPLLANNSERAHSLADAELLRLADEYIAAEQKCCDLESKADEMKGHLFSKRPCPEILRWRETDGELGLGCRGEWWDQYSDVDPMRLKEWATPKQIKNDNEITFSTRRFVPSDAARDRAHEIIAAFDEWDRDRKPPRGYKKAVRAAERAQREYRLIEDRIAKTRATTVEGMLAKIRCAHAYAKSDEIDSIESGGAEEVMALSIFEDIKLAAAVSTPSIISAAPAGGVGLPLPPLVSDQTNAALDRVRTAEKLFDRCWDQYDNAKTAAADELGERPDGLIAWRNYSHTTGPELARIRDEFLVAGEDPSMVEQEYRDAKKRYRATVKAGKDWDKRAGVDLMSKAFDEARAEMESARRALGSVELQSVTDASAIVCSICANIKRYDNDGSLDPWEAAALGNAGSFLKRWMASVTARRGGRRSAATAA